MSILSVIEGKHYIVTGVTMTYDQKLLRTGMCDTGTKLRGIRTEGKYGVFHVVSPGWHTLIKGKDSWENHRIKLTDVNIFNIDGTTSHEIAKSEDIDPPLEDPYGIMPLDADYGSEMTSGSTTVGESYYLLKSGSHVSVYTNPTNGDKKNDSIMEGEANGGTQLIIYQTWTNPNNPNEIMGAIDAAGSKWVTLQMGSTGKQNASLEKIDAVQAPLGAEPQSQSTTAPTSAAVESSGKMIPITNADGEVIEVNADTYANWQAAYEAANSIAGITDYGSNSAALEAISKMQHCIGMPPLITEAADPRYMKSSSGDGSSSAIFGRSYVEMFMMNNCTVNLKPVSVKYLPGIEKSGGAGWIEQIVSWAGGADLDEPFRSDPNSLQGQLWETEDKYADYIETVNVLARTIAQLLGIGDRQFPNGKAKYKNMDYTYYNVNGENSFFQDVSAGFSSGSGIFSSLGGAISAGAAHLFKRGVTDVINDESFVHFYMSGDGFSSGDGMSVTTKSTSIEGLFNNGLSEMAADLQFLFGNTGGVDKFAEGLTDGISGILDITGLSSVSALNGLIRNGANYLKGARIVFPQQLDDCSYDRSLSCSCRFISPNGDPESQFLYCYLPLCYLWPYVLPQMLTDNMYRYPFMCKMDCPGVMRCDLAAMSNLRIQKGGADGTSWGADGRPFEISVSFDITPLYSKLMVTSSRHPILFMSNTALHEYLGCMVGVNFSGDNLEQKIQIAMNLLKGGATDTLTSTRRGYIDSVVAKKIRGIFNF